MTLPDSGSFAAASARIVARQEQRRIEAANARQQTRSSSAVSGPLQPLHNYLHSTWTLLTSNSGTSPPVRVTQLDTSLLDDELLTLLKTQITEALRLFPQTLQDAWTHEIDLVLRAILFKLSIWDNNASYGGQLQGLQYSDARSRSRNDYSPPTKWQKLAYGVITVLGSYFTSKAESRLLEAEASYQELSETNKFLQAVLPRINTAHNLLSLMNFLVFLVNGRYRTLADRLLRMRLVSPSSQTHREVSFEYLNRQLVWHAFTEFLLFILPLVGIGRWRRWLARAWKRTNKALTSDGSGVDDEAEKVKTGPLAYLPERTCAICYEQFNPSSTSGGDGTGAGGEILGANAAVGGGGGVIGSVQTDIVSPYETKECGCIYCFTCIATKIEQEEGSGWTCLRCGEIVKRCRPWRGDVLEEAGNTFQPSRQKKSVAFDSQQDIDNPQEHEEPEIPPPTYHDSGYETANSAAPESFEWNAPGTSKYEFQEESGLGSSEWQFTSRSIEHDRDHH